MSKLIIIVSLCLAFVSLLPGCSQVEANPQEVVNEFLEAFMADDLDGTMSYFADDAVFNALNANEEFSDKEELRGYIDFLMRQVIDMETRNFSLDGDQVTWEASLERRSTPTEISYSAIVEAGKISYLQTALIVNDD